jgi:hypothetical protein
MGLVNYKAKENNVLRLKRFIKKIEKIEKKGDETGRRN